MASEICLGTVTSLSSALTWLRSTFWHVRLRSNPLHYKLPRGADDGRIAAYLRTSALTQLLALYRVGCVRLHRLPDASGGQGAAASASSSSGGGAGVHSGERGAVFEPSSWEEMLAQVAPPAAAGVSAGKGGSGSGTGSGASGGQGNVLVSPLTPAFILTRNYLRFGTLALFPVIREWPLLYPLEGVR